jgi:ferritin
VSGAAEGESAADCGKTRKQEKGVTAPMLIPALEKALNAQLNAEYYSSYLYLAKAAYFESVDLPGMASWMRMQAVEEHAHAMRFYQYIIDRDGEVDLDQIAKPPKKWDSPRVVFENVLEHEREVTELISKLVGLAFENGDHATHNFLQWFVAEQVEEEATAKDVLSRVKLVGDNGQGLFLIDRELAERRAPPAADDSPGA